MLVACSPFDGMLELAPGKHVVEVIVPTTQLVDQSWVTTVPFYGMRRTVELKDGERKVLEFSYVGRVDMFKGEFAELRLGQARAWAKNLSREQYAQKLAEFENVVNDAETVLNRFRINRLHSQLYAALDVVRTPGAKATITLRDVPVYCGESTAPQGIESRELELPAKTCEEVAHHVLDYELDHLVNKAWRGAEIELSGVTELSTTASQNGWPDLAARAGRLKDVITRVEQERSRIRDETVTKTDELIRLLGTRSFVSKLTPER